MTEIEKTIAELTAQHVIEDFTDAQIEQLIMHLEVYLREKNRGPSTESKL